MMAGNISAKGDESKKEDDGRKREGNYFPGENKHVDAL
jgi:hypothetical protein